jgi:hypothetical protein
MRIMAKPKKTNTTHRNVVLKISTYDRLQRFLVDLVKDRGTPRVSFDEAIAELLDRAEK